MAKSHYQVVIAGGGTAGLTVAAQLMDQPNPPEIALIEPSTVHYYQPLWTLVGAGVFPREQSARPEADYIPPGVTWLKERVTAFDPDNNSVTLSNGETITYDFLVVALGIQIDWGKVKGLPETLGKNGVCSNYSYDTVEYTWQNIRTFRGGNAVFTHPSTPIKCGGAPQKIVYLADDYFRRSGVRQQSQLNFYHAGAAIFAVKKYADALNRVVARKGINVHYQHDLIEVRGEAREAVFRNLATQETVTVHFDMLHVSPPQSAPDVIKSSALANSGGWVDVDQYTLQHKRYPNVFSLGDCSSLPTSKTGAAVRKQAPVVVANLMAAIAKETLPATYDGYTSCPLVTGYGSLILAEFDYTNQPKESFPFDQSQERYSMYALKAYGLPAMYWNGMLRGRM
ncbi:NAD(P)/FAD-dependent oxidoreductase [Chloroflexus aggregans]|jgi:sulfide:quinone oxidoreductase|uniref:FAD-dependent pyridine nucleotide-disulphide oxidoreductase n=3 Tax=Chloroflexus aggregans TaxID=152260 RepID=B8GC24_CHLAD|nr:FAD/NAD(P)-binding oxidoreductase [Chloroflexus aggregans]ACL22998.1 FAD-dependent pyridine nucleotide-disulphide oxidoreductase [Chloroflexus aggregans DSM 9485]BBH72792.1 sulfide:quinone oxidoreductase [Chloroflexus aggregans]